VTPALTLAAALENALNLYIKQDPDALRKLAALTGKVIALSVTGTGLTFYFLADDAGLRVLGHYEGSVDTHLSGTPLGCARLAFDKRGAALFEGAVAIDGDTDTGQAFQDLLGGVDWDWEEQLSRLTGDVVAHQAGRFAGRARQFIHDSRETLAGDAGEYLQEEARLLPGQTELGYFLGDVDRLRDDVERLQARVERLLRRVATPS